MPDHRLPVHPSLSELEQEAEALVREGVDIEGARAGYGRLIAEHGGHT